MADVLNPPLADVLNQLSTPVIANPAKGVGVAISHSCLPPRREHKFNIVAQSITLRPIMVKYPISNLTFKFCYWPRRSNERNSVS